MAVQRRRSRSDVLGAPSLSKPGGFHRPSTASRAPGLAGAQPSPVGRQGGCPGAGSPELDNAVFASVLQPLANS